MITRGERRRFGGKSNSRFWTLFLLSTITSWNVDQLRMQFFEVTHSHQVPHTVCQVVFAVVTIQPQVDVP